MSIVELVKTIERNHLGHFAFLPKHLGFDVREVDGVTIINCGLKTSMFNIAYGSPQVSMDAICKIKQAFNGQPFAWWVPPSQHNPSITEELFRNGFVCETVEHAMSCNLLKVSPWTPKTNLSIAHVVKHGMLKDFIHVLEPYDIQVSEFYGKVSEELLRSDEKLFVGYVGAQPVTIGILFVCGNSAGIFSLLTKEDARGHGYGADMMVFLMRIAKECGCHSITLSASSDSGYRIYERLGFIKIGEFECFEYHGEGEH